MSTMASPRTSCVHRDSVPFDLNVWATHRSGQGPNDNMLMSPIECFTGSMFQ